MNIKSTMKTTPKMETCNNVRCIIYYLKVLLMTPEILSAIKTGNRISFK